MSLAETEGLTIEDLEAMPDDGRRYELLGGSIVVNAAPRPRHQVALAALYELVRAACPTRHVALFAPVDLDLPGGQRVEPDLVVVPHSSVGEERLSLPVLLVAELISSSTVVWDAVAKRQAYAESGIPHYWMVDTRKGRESFVALRLEGDGYETAFESTDRLHTESPVAVSAPLASLFELCG